MLPPPPKSAPKSKKSDVKNLDIPSLARRGLLYKKGTVAILRQWLYENGVKSTAKTKQGLVDQVLQKLGIASES